MLMSIDCGNSGTARGMTGSAVVDDGHLVSMAKIHAANILHDAADVGIPINGARGYSKDTVLEWIYRYARQARLVDGADEVHKMVLNRLLGEEGNGFWTWPVDTQGPDREAR